MPYPKNMKNKYSLSFMLCATDDHINKECNRRGIAHQHMKTKEDKVLAIIRHDAYYEGADDARHGAVVGSYVFSHEEPTPMLVKQEQKTAKGPKRRNYILRDWQDNEITYMRLTDDQGRLMEWLIRNNFLTEVDFEETDEIKFEEI